MVCERILWTELNPTTILALRVIPIVFEFEKDVCHGGVRLRQRAIEFKRLEGCGLGFRERLTWCQEAVPSAKDPGVGDPNPGEGIAGIQVHRSTVVVQPNLDVPFRAFV